MLMEKDILSRKKTYVYLDELEKLINANEYDDFYSEVSALVKKGTLKPIKKVNGTNGLIPPLFVKYWICRPAEQDEPLKEEIMHLDGDLNISFYLSNPKKYREQRDIIYPLSEFLKNTNFNKARFGACAKNIQRGQKHIEPVENKDRR